MNSYGRPQPASARARGAKKPSAAIQSQYQTVSARDENPNSYPPEVLEVD